MCRNISSFIDIFRMLNSILKIAKYRHGLWFKYIQRCLSTKFHFTEINRFGKLEITCPNTVATIQPIDPFEIPDGNEAVVEITSNEETVDTTNDLRKHINVYYDENESTVFITEHPAHAFENNDGVRTLRIEIPHNYDIFANVRSLDLKETEGNTLKVITESDCSLGKIKSDVVDLQVNNGKLTCQSLFGNGRLAVSGGIEITKLQSKHCDLYSDGGICISGVYCNQMTCRSQSGTIQFGSLHGRSNLRSESGSVSISALAGDTDIQTSSGDVSLTIDSCENCFVSSDQGNVDIGLSESVSAFLEGEGCYIDVEEDLLFDGMKRESSDGRISFEGKLGNGDNSVQARSIHGSISFTRKNWFSKFNNADIE